MATKNKTLDPGSFKEGLDKLLQAAQDKSSRQVRLPYQKMNGSQATKALVKAIAEAYSLDVSSEIDEDKLIVKFSVPKAKAALGAKAAKKAAPRALVPKVARLSKKSTAKAKA